MVDIGTVGLPIDVRDQSIDGEDLHAEAADPFITLRSTVGNYASGIEGLDAGMEGVTAISAGIGTDSGLEVANETAPANEFLLAVAAKDYGFPVGLGLQVL